MHAASHLVQGNTLMNGNHYWYYYYLLRSCDICFCVQGHSPLVLCDSKLQPWWAALEHNGRTPMCPPNLSSASGLFL